MLARRFPLKPPQLTPSIKPLSPEEARKGKPYPDNAILWTEEALQALQRFLRDLHQTVEGGLPAGFFTGAPTQVRAGLPSLPGDPGSGWSSGTHRHAIFTAQASPLTPVSLSAEGGSAALSRADHTHNVTRIMADVLAKSYLFG